MRVRTVAVALVVANSISCSPLPSKDEDRASHRAAYNQAPLDAALDRRETKSWVLKIELTSGDAVDPVKEVIHVPVGTSASRATLEPKEIEQAPFMPQSPRVRFEDERLTPAHVANKDDDGKKSKYRKSWKSANDKDNSSPAEKQKPETLKEHWNRLNTTQKKKFAAGATLVGFAASLPITAPLSAVIAGTQLGRKQRDKESRQATMNAAADGKASPSPPQWTCGRDGRCITLNGLQQPRYPPPPSQYNAFGQPRPLL